MRNAARIPTRLASGLGAPLLALLAGCASLGGAPVGEVAELVAEGGTKPLRDPPRPIRGTTRALVFALDGVGDDDLRRALHEGRMPRTAALLGAPTGEPGTWAHAWAAPDVLTVLPTTTLAAWVSAFTGRPPGETGVPGDEWWERDAGRLRAPVPVSVESRADAIRLFTDGLLGESVAVPTVWERADLRSHVAGLPLHRGADLLQLPDLNDAGDLAVRAVGDALEGERRDTATFRETDENVVASLLSDLGRHGVPDLQVVYLGAVDPVAHFTPDPLTAQQRYLGDVVDPLVGRVLDAWRERGALDRTWVVLVSDHGQVPVPPDERHALDAERDGRLGRALAGAGFRLRPAELDADAPDAQAVLAFQGSSAFLYLADRSGCPARGDACDWTRAPRWEEDVLEAGRALWSAPPGGLRDALELVVLRRADGSLFVMEDGDAVPLAEHVGRMEADRPELEARLRALAGGPHGDRAGDLILLARSGTERPLSDRFYFGEDGYHSWHGSAAPQDSYVPLLTAHPRLSGAQVRARVEPVLGGEASILDLTPLLLDLLEVERAADGEG